ncbi:hypothetical protein RRG08_009766 [Elysia crispata]|uniref:Uncharacterized protein n=1 Tax=Elysia crispata TaxID=231223 RepID=A0AAE1DLG9_9GAST|nr:hypothetical protein RRG08_009766 [Elysia crispata]
MVAENLTLIHRWQRNLTQNRAKSVRASTSEDGRPFGQSLEAAFDADLDYMNDLVPDLTDLPITPLFTGNSWLQVQMGIA